MTSIAEISAKLSCEKETIERIIAVLKSTKNRGRDVYIIGNGGSASTATHFACDLFKMAGIKAHSFDNAPLNSAIINDDGWSDLYINQLKKVGLIESDVVIAFSVHGGVGSDKAGAWSQNINKAIDYANEIGAITIGFSGFDGGYLKEACKFSLVIPAESTPLVESFHVVLHHLIAFILQEGDRI